MNVSEIRLDLSSRFSGTNQEYLDGRYGVRLLLRNREFPVYTDCFRYIFGHDDQLLEKVTVTISTGKSTDTPQPFDLAIYGYLTKIRDIQHVGIVTPNLNVISKWGMLGNVFEHPPDHVYYTYGPIEYFRVDMEKISGYCHPSLVKLLEERK